MNVQRALTLLPPDATVTATCRPDHYGGAWLVQARFTARDCPVHGDTAGALTCPECDRATVEVRASRVVTQFAEPFSAARWVNEFDRSRRQV